MIEQPATAPAFLPPSSPLTTYPPSQYVFAGLAQGGVVRWNGTAWQQVNGTGAYSLTGTALHVYQLAVDPFNPSTILIATDGGIYRTTDALGDCAWEQLIPTATLSIEASPSISGTFYGGSGAGGGAHVRITTDYGETWVRSNLPSAGYGETPKDFCISTVSTETLYIPGGYYSSHAFWRSTDNGLNWNRFTNLPKDGAFCCATDPFTNVVYMAEDTWIFGKYYIVKSTNSGGYWTQVEPSDTTRYSDVNVSPYTAHVWATDYNNKRVYWSIDRGTSWISHTFATAGTTAVDFGLPDEVWVGANVSGSTVYVWQSTDSGSSWVSRGFSGSGNVRDIVPLGRYYYALAVRTLSLVTATPEVKADGVATGTITVTVVGENGTPLPGVTVTLSAAGVATLTQPLAPTDENGRVTGTISSRQVGIVRVSAHVIGVNLGETALVTFVGADLAVHSHAPAMATAGTTIAYTLWLTNSGLMTATGVVMTDTLSPYVDFITCTGPVSCGQDGQTLTWSLGTMRAGEHASATVTATIDPAAPQWSLLTNTVEAQADQPEHDLGNNIATVSTRVQHAMRADPAPLLLAVARGTAAGRVVTVYNDGQSDLHAVAATLPITVMTWLSGESLELGTIGAHASKPFTVTAAPGSSETPGYRQGYVKIESAEGAKQYVALTVYVGSGVAGTLAFTVTDEIAPIPGAQVTIMLPGDPDTGLGNLVLENLTDEVGQVTFTSIPSGTYNYRIVAPGYVSTWGQQEVHGGTQGVTEQLWSDYLDYQWAVTETVVTDVYNIYLTITYQLGQAPHPVVVPCGPWKEIDMGAGGTAGGVLELRNSTGIDAEGVIISPSVRGITMTIANNGHLGQVNGGGEVQIEFQVTGTNVPDDYEAGSVLVSGTFVSGTERVSFTHNINLLVNPTHDIDCHCVSDPEEYHAYCEIPEVPGDPGQGVAPPPFWPGWDPIQKPPQSQVQVRLSQQAVLARQAFWSELVLTSKDADLTELDLDVTILDDQGQDRTAEFLFSSSGASWDGLPAHTSNKWRWTILPGPCLGGQYPDGVMYYIYVHVSFEANGQAYEFDTAQVGIVVRPQPRVFLYYYLPYEIEAGRPFRVQIIAQDWGYGQAQNLQMSVPAIELISNTTSFSLQVEDSDLDFGTIEPFQQVLGYVDLKPNQDAYVSAIAALLQHRDLQGLKVNPLILRASMYLVYTDSVQWITATELPDPGAWCAPQEPPPEPQLVRVWGWQEKVAALPGDTITHNYTVYNTSQSSPITVSLDMFSEHGWLEEEGRAPSSFLVIEPRRGVAVQVHLAVPEGTEYGTEDTGALEGHPILDPFMRDGDSTVTRVDSVKIVSIEVSPGTILQRNADGWYEPNPIIYTVVVESQLECSPVPTCWPGLLFEIRGSDRLQAIPLPHQFPGEEERTTGAFWDCRDGRCEEGIGAAPVTTGQHRISWQIWVQPGTATRLISQAGIVWPDDPFNMVYVRAPDVWVPDAQIHPVIVVPGSLGTWPPSSDGRLEPYFHTYDPLLDYLGMLGYEQNASLFEFPYDWREGVTVTAPLLDAAIHEITNDSPETKPYVNYTQVDIVGHSMGGLLARAYLEGQTYRGDVGKLITLATPHQGAPEDYLFWEGLRVRGDWTFQMFFSNKLYNWAKSAGYCGVVCGFRGCTLFCTKENQLEYVHNEALAFRDMLPAGTLPAPYLVRAADPQDPYPFGRPANPFLDDLNSDGGTYDLGRLRNSGPVCWALYSVNYPGNPNPTVLGFNVGGPFSPFWEHGMPSGEGETGYIKGTARTLDEGGDHVVPGYSAAGSLLDWTGLVTWTVAQDQGGWHETLPKECRFMNQIASILTGITLPPNSHIWNTDCAYYGQE